MELDFLKNYLGVIYRNKIVKMKYFKINIILVGLLFIVLFACERPTYLNPLDPGITPEDWAPANPKAEITTYYITRLTWQHNCPFEEGFIIERKTENDVFSEIGRTGANVIFPPKIGQNELLEQLLLIPHQI